jgi:hypothetical protein
VLKRQKGHNCDLVAGDDIKWNGMTKGWEKGRRKITQGFVGFEREFKISVLNLGLGQPGFLKNQ